MTCEEMILKKLQHFFSSCSLFLKKLSMFLNENCSMVSKRPSEHSGHHSNTSSLLTALHTKIKCSSALKILAKRLFRENYHPTKNGGFDETLIFKTFFFQNNLMYFVSINFQSHHRK